MIARNTKADINVIALIVSVVGSTRARKDLKEEGLSRSVVIVATSDQPALVRLKAAFMATAVAEYFRSGKDVPLLMDSLTRLPWLKEKLDWQFGSHRYRGYTPSVFSSMPKLLES